jgi:hypothetical protein
MDTSTSNPATPELPKNALPIKATIKEAWGYLHGFKATYWLAFLILLLIAFAFGLSEAYLDPNYLNASQINMALIGHHYSGIVFLLSLIGNIINFLISYGITYLGLRRATNLPIKTRMMFRTFKSPLIAKLLGLCLIKLLIIAVFIILTIPIAIFLSHIMGHHPSTMAVLVIALSYVICLVLFVFVFLRITLALPLILDKGLNPFAAIGHSFVVTKGYVWRMFWIAILVAFIMLVSIIPVGIGLIWSLPLGGLILPVIYKRLVGISMTE